MKILTDKVATSALIAMGIVSLAVIVASGVEYIPGLSRHVINVIQISIGRGIALFPIVLAHWLGIDLRGWSGNLIWISLGVSAAFWTAVVWSVHRVWSHRRHGVNSA